MKNIYAELISIGDEILYGQTLDTNSHWISKQLDQLGVRVKRKITISDDRESILTAFKEAESHADIVLITGGLGPTNDDLTKPCLAEYFDSEMYMDEEALASITERFAKRGRTLNELNKMQAELPVKCEKIENAIGTAPGMWFEERNTVFVSMPGVPSEMKLMMENIILPKLKAKFKTPVILHQLVKTVGIPESVLAEKLTDWEAGLPEPIKLAYLPTLSQVKLRLTATGDNKEELQQLINKEVDKLYPLVGKYIFGTNEDNLEKKVGELLKEQGLTIACAESCTGGRLSHMITTVPGSSAYFQGSIIPYHNEYKINELGVEAGTIAQNGAVSEETVREMAANVRLKFGADIGVATSGIAGPGGGTPEKPVGTVWIALATGEEVKTKLLNFSSDRESNIKLTAIAVLNLVRQTLVRNY